MPRSIRKQTLLQAPVVINRTSKEYYGFMVTSDQEDNVTVTALYKVPRQDGTIDRSSVGVEASLVVDLPEFAVVNKAVQDNS